MSPHPAPPPPSPPRARVGWLAERLLSALERKHCLILAVFTHGLTVRLQRSYYKTMDAYGEEVKKIDAATQSAQAILDQMNAQSLVLAQVRRTLPASPALTPHVTRTPSLSPFAQTRKPLRKKQQGLGRARERVLRCVCLLFGDGVRLLSAGCDAVRRGHQPREEP